MPAYIIIKVSDEAEAQALIRKGAHALAGELEDEGTIKPASLVIDYLTPDEEKRSREGDPVFFKKRSRWAEDPTDDTP
jgi:hypothetical protein